ncbi:hypothetical protein SBA5_80092 [Candidatus Sulfotelmatomonas gaucii]|uniref:Uncharacterized protein n=1 Tax=Candidatus Sulfuritelmatomonas gaucii TaxID=2043161 RepID=A0A2N9M5G7_9BACT|nr:hypothetical protein SBA5_80092 [Candidatus Sulfotelmatomonas gaucii]
MELCMELNVPRLQAELRQSYTRFIGVWSQNMNEVTDRFSTARQGAGARGNKGTRERGTRRAPRRARVKLPRKLVKFWARARTAHRWA